LAVADRRRLLFTGRTLYLADWRPTVLLLAAVLCRQDVELADRFFHEVLDELGPNPTLAKRARCVGLIGSALRDLKSWGYRLTDPRYPEHLDRCLAIFDRREARKVDFATRLEAADAIGQAGDPRLDHNDPTYWVRVEGARFWMGAQKSDPKGINYDPEASTDEAPVHREEIGPFQMGRYPVAVINYLRFKEAGGYSREEYWKAGDFGQYTEPRSWQRQLRYPNRPVVEVSWFEAAAYCAWAGGRLPTEAEWECAARGGREGVPYPSGDQKLYEYGANFKNQPGYLTPVGLYPEGAAPGGIEDLAGNCWEWVGERWRKYYGKETKPEEARVARGGGWGNNVGLLRVSTRLGVLPDVRSPHLGFRVVRDIPA